MLRSISLTAITAALLATASGASATVFNVSSAGLYNYGTVQMSGNIPGYGALDRSEYAGVLVLSGTTDGGTAFSLTSYCFDILHNISVGFGYQAGVNYTFTSTPLANDLSGNAGTGNALTANQIERMSGLAQLGSYMFKKNVSDLSSRMAAIQAAIWSVEYGFTASSFSSSTAQGFYSNYMGRSFPGVTTPVLVASNAQGQIIGTAQGQGLGAVPEPETWALMVLGFGLIGVSSRRRSPSRTVAA
jgi:hypothetical protein